MSDSKKVHKYFAQPIFHYQLENYETHNQDLKKYKPKVVKPKKGKGSFKRKKS